MENTKALTKHDEKMIDEIADIIVNGKGNTPLLILDWHKKQKAMNMHDELIKAMKLFIHCADGCQNGVPKYLQIPVNKAKELLKQAEEK